MAWATNGDITTAMVKQFGANVEALSQQKGSKLRNACRVETGVVGEEAYYDQVESTAAVKKTTRNSDTPIVKTVFNRRRVAMYDYEWADLLDKQDKLKMLVDPENIMAQNAAWALGRAIDDALISALGGTAYYGKAGGSSIALPTSQVIASGSAAMTVAKLLTAKETLDKQDVDPEEERFLICGAAQIADLLNTTEVKSSDYNTVKALAMGQIDSFLGFKFIMTNRLATQAGGANDDRICYAYAKSGLLLAMAEEITTKIEPRADKSYATQIYVRMGIGATRMEEKKVVQIICEE